MLSRRLVLGVRALVALLAGAALLACGEAKSGPEAGSPTAVERGTSALPTSDPAGGVNEMGSHPVYWRTADRFQSVRVNVPYKVVVRVTNGFAEDALRIVARHDDGGEPVVFEAARASPAGPDAAGSYYVFSIELARAGAWRVTAQPGEDVSVDIEVGA